MKNIMEKFEIIRLKKKGWSSVKISNEFNIARNTVDKYWNEYLSAVEKLENGDYDDEHDIIELITEKPKYDSSGRGPLKYNAEIDAALKKILDDEEKKTELLGKNHKQALTKKQIHKLLIDQGFKIGLTTISTKINEIRNEKKETFIKQDYDYGDRFEYDFGEISLIIDGRQTKGYLAVLTAPASGFRWAYLYHNTKMEVFLDSQVRFFEMLGGSFNEGVYDNMKNVVSKFIGRNEKQINQQLVKLALYYDFEINVTNCFSGNEKGTVENAVKWIRNKVFAIAYKFPTFEEADRYLQNELVKINMDSSIEEEKKHLKSYMPKYETAVITENLVDKYSFIHLEGNIYSVPEDLCGKTVTVKSYPGNICILYRGAIVATHEKTGEKGKTYIDIRHYLHTFTKKPGALKNSLALKSHPELKKIFDLYYKEKPKSFIAILRENADSSIEELLVKLTPMQNSTDIQTTAKVENKTNEQINLLKDLFVGGKKYVN